MTDFSDLLRPDAVVAGLAVVSKKALWGQLGAMGGQLLDVDPRLVAERLAERERIGSTGFGGGVAIPHARLPGLAAPVGLFARLAHPIDYHAVDDIPVDLVFALLSPERAGSQDALVALFTTPETRSAA